MRILCKGFNLYNQLNGEGKCMNEFQPSFDLESLEHFHLSHTFSTTFANNSLRIHCKFLDKNTVNSEIMGKIKQITANDQIVLILNSKGQLFKVTLDECHVEPVPNFIGADDKIKLISSNSKLTVAYSEQGYLYNIPEKLDYHNIDVVDMQTGREHCVLLDKFGNVYTFGSGSRGQLGTGQLDEQPNPVLVQALAGIKIMKIAAGGWHSAAISKDGDLYTWGWNGNGQLGLAGSPEGSNDRIVSVMATPHVVDITGSPEYCAVQVACGSKHTLVLLDNNVLYGCGWNKYKQVKNENQEDCHSFVQIGDFSNERIEKILCGPWNSAVICGHGKNRTALT